MAADDLAEMANATGAMQDAFAEQTDTLEFKINKLSASWEAVTISAIDNFAEPAAEALEGIAIIINNIEGAVANIDWSYLFPPLGVYNLLSDLFSVPEVSLTNALEITSSFKDSLKGLSEQQLEDERVILEYYWNETYLKMQNADLSDEELRTLEVQLQTYEAQAAAFDQLNKKKEDGNNKSKVAKELTAEEKKKLEEWQKQEKTLAYQISLIGKEGLEKTFLEIDHEHAELVAKFGDKPLIIEYITKKKDDALSGMLNEFDEGVSDDNDMLFDDLDAEIEREQLLSDRKQEIWLEEQEVRKALAEQELEREQMKASIYVASLDNMAGAMTTFAKMSTGQSAILFAAQKGFALASAAISAKESVVHAYNEGTKWGGPVLGAIFATTAGIAQAANMLEIAKQNPGSSSVSMPSVSTSIPSQPVSPVNNYSSVSSTNVQQPTTINNYYTFEGHNLVTEEGLQKLAREMAPEIQRAQDEGNVQMNSKYYS